MRDGAYGLLVYDGTCGFCSRSARWIESKWPPSGSATAVPWQQLGTTVLAALGLSEHEVTREAWWVEDGRRSGGHLAVARSLIAAGRGWGVVGRLLLVPPVRWLAAIGYRIVALNRGRLPDGTPACRT